MKLIKPSFEIIEQPPGLDGIFKMIEIAGRTCYKSEDKITEDSAKKFVDMLINRGHTAVLEQGTIYLTIPADDFFYPEDILNYPWVKCTKLYYGFNKEPEYYYITSNYRWIIENDLEDLLDYICEPTEHHTKRVCVKFITDRGVSHELVRHRKFSFCQESTRYCNYSLNKFNNELTFIEPSWSLAPMVPEDFNGDHFTDALLDAEDSYLYLIEHGWTPQQARQVLPNALKTEVVMTGFIDDWEHFFDLRCDKAAHPDMRALAIPLKEEFIKREYING